MPFFLLVRAPGTKQGAEETEVNRFESRATEAVIAQAERFTKRSKFGIGQTLSLRENHTLASLVTKANLPLDAGQLETISDLFRNATDDVKARYGAAYRNKTPIERTSSDLTIIGFIRAAHVAVRAGAEIIICPDLEWSWRYEPVDPATLACPTPENVEYDVIESARVTGGRELGNIQMDLFEDAQLIDVLISLDHKYSEIRHRMTLKDAQEVWKGKTMLSAEIRIQTGDWPAVLGNLNLQRE